MSAQIAETGGMDMLHVFEYANNADHPCCVFQSSSSEIFGDIAVPHHSKDSVFNPKTLYGAMKLFAHIMAETCLAFVQVNPEYYRHYGPAQPLADVRKARRFLNRPPQRSLTDLIQDIVRFELSHGI